MLSPSQAPAGTKRLSNLLRCHRWSHILLDRFLWHRAEQALGQLGETGEAALAIRDESVLEKAGEYCAGRVVCPVRSSKAARLKRIKLLLMVGLVYAFLLSLITQESASLVQDLPRGWCHRTEKRYRKAAIPLSRIQAALSSLWLAYPPTFSICQENPG